MTFTHALRPIMINRLEVKNRIFRSSHGTYYGKTGINDRLIAYHEARARAGIGLTTLEVCVVHPSSASNATIYAWDDGIIPGFRRISTMAHDHGMALFAQLWHGGHHWPPLDGSPSWSPSDVPSPWGPIPRPMDEARIDEIVAAFAAAAVRARAGGLDGIELHFGHGYLVHQFLSPMTNRREDGYGGSLDNRMRFGREVLRAVRKAVGDDFALGIRISDQHVDGGLSVAEAAAAVRGYCDEGLLDFVNGSMGSYHDVASMLPAMETPTGAMMPSAGPIVAGATGNVVRMVAGRFQTIEEADQLIRDGAADMVAIVRAMIADPDLMTKTLAGRADEVRPCIGCNQGCVGGILGADPGIGCTVNPTVGREATLHESLIVPAAEPLKLVVVGGGPAGLEAARLAATSGYHVVLFEAASRLGGAINIARRAPKLHPIGDIVGWLERQVYALGVDIRLSTYAEEAEILAEHPDAVLVATGAMPRGDGRLAANPGIEIAGHDRPNVHSGRDIFDVPLVALGGHAVVYDDVGHYEAIAVAEYLIEHGVAVTFVTRHAGFAPTVDGFVRTEPALRRLRQGDFTLVPRARIDAVGDGTCTLAWIEGGATWEVIADRVVIVGYNRPLTDVYDRLAQPRANRPPLKLRRIGDADAPRDLQAAIASGHMAGRFLDR